MYWYTELIFEKWQLCRYRNSLHDVWRIFRGTPIPRR